MPTLIVTGSSGRLGQVVAEKFSQLGYTVVGVAEHSGDASDSSYYQADLTDEASVGEVMARIRSDQGGFDVLIHAVGMWDGRPTAEVSFEEWRRVMDVNLTSTFLVFREALRAIEADDERRPVRLIAFASGQGADRGQAEQAAYSAAKAGVIRLVESIAAEYRDRRVTAHAIAPSMILFDGMEKEKGIPADDLANLCVVLAGKAGDSMSGTTIRAYGTRY